MVSIRVTSKCQLRCRHCLFGCRPGIGEHMTPSTFVDSMCFCEGIGENLITLSGGEPTMNPDFFVMLDWALNRDFTNVLVVTNGAAPNKTKRLINLYEERQEWADEVFSLEVSEDDFHAEWRCLDPEIWLWASSHKNYRGDGRHIRRARHETIINMGSAIENGLGCNEFPCDYGITIDPNGDVYWCTHRDCKPFGNVSDESLAERFCEIRDVLYEQDYQVGEHCIHEHEFANAIEEAANSCSST